MKQRVQANKLGASDVFFDSLVRNAIDFLQMSVKELEKQPKYSVIHFAMSVELFLKARLLREHWSLVVSKIEKASLQAFRNGEFVSVTMDECLQRLGNIANDSLLTHEQECFRAIRDHRNKLVHFFHPEYQSPVNKKLLPQIVSEQLKAWFYLHRLLTIKWADHFNQYSKQITRLQKMLRRNQQFLAAKFKALDPEIKEARKQGQKFGHCVICGYESGRIKSIFDPLFTRQCLVCDWSSNFLQIPCPKCGKDILIESGEFGMCENCESTIGFDDLMEKFGPNDPPDEESSIAYCSFCENYKASVIPFGNESHLCLNCFELHDDVGSCGWCGSLITGDTDGTSIGGCFQCGGPDLKD